MGLGSRRCVEVPHSSAPAPHTCPDNPLSVIPRDNLPDPDRRGLTFLPPRRGIIAAETVRFAVIARKIRKYGIRPIETPCRVTCQQAGVSYSRRILLPSPYCTLSVTCCNILCDTGNFSTYISGDFRIVPHRVWRLYVLDSSCMVGASRPAVQPELFFFFSYR